MNKILDAKQKEEEAKQTWRKYLVWGTLVVLTLLVLAKFFCDGFFANHIPGVWRYMPDLSRWWHVLLFYLGGVIFVHVGVILIPPIAVGLPFALACASAAKYFWKWNFWLIFVPAWLLLSFFAYVWQQNSREARLVAAMTPEEKAAWEIEEERLRREEEEEEAEAEAEEARQSQKKKASEREEERREEERRRLERWRSGL